MSIFLYAAMAFLAARPPSHHGRATHPAAHIRHSVERGSAYDSMMHFFDTVQWEPGVKQLERDRYKGIFSPNDDLQPTYYGSPWRHWTYHA